jgi:hypothetical protein
MHATCITIVKLAWDVSEAASRAAFAVTFARSNVYAGYVDGCPPKGLQRMPCYERWV